MFIMYLHVKQEAFSSVIDPQEDLCVQAVNAHRQHNSNFSIYTHPSLQDFCPKLCSFTNADDARDEKCEYQKSRDRCQRLPLYGAAMSTQTVSRRHRVWRGRR